MKYLMLTIILLMPFSVNASPTFYDEPDKVQHTKYSAIGANTLHLIGLTPVQSFWTIAAIGAIKELTDNNTSRERSKDMLANIVGASTVFAWEWEF